MEADDGDADEEEEATRCNPSIRRCGIGCPGEGFEMHQRVAKRTREAAREARGGSTGSAIRTGGGSGPGSAEEKGQEVKGKESQGAAGGVTVPKQYHAYAAGSGKDQIAVHLHDGVMGNIYTRVGGRWVIGDFGELGESGK